MLPTLRARSAEAEAQRALHAATVADLDRVGIFSGLQPRRWGGLELAPSVYFQGVVLVASACGAAGWVGGVLGVHPWELACMHPDAQTDVWGADPTTRASSSYAPTGRARRVSDGYLVEGVWRFSSGVDHAAWALLGALVAGEEALGPRVFLVPRADFTVDPESWQVSGLAGTGSKDVHVAGAVVPEHRTHLFADLARMTWARPGWALNDVPVYRMPWMNVFAWAIAAAALGAATGLVEEYRIQSTTRVGAYGGPPVAENQALHQRLADATFQLESMTRAMVAGWQELEAMAERGAIDEVVAARGRHAAARTIADSLDAALLVFAQAGGSAMDLANPLQRYLRDLLAMRNHPIAALDRFATEQARLELRA